MFKRAGKNYDAETYSDMSPVGNENCFRWEIVNSSPSSDLLPPRRRAFPRRRQPHRSTHADSRGVENGQFASQFSPVARYHEADYSTFRDAKQAQSCAGFRRTGNQRRGGYDWIMGGIVCAPPGRTLTNDQLARFIDRVRLQ